MKKPDNPLKSLQDRLAKVEKEVASIPRRGRFVSYHEDGLRKAALQFARCMEGYYQETHTVTGQKYRVDITNNDSEFFKDMYLRQMQKAATELLRELSVEEPD